MKSLLVVIDGLGDEKIASLGNHTPFTFAKHKYMDMLGQKGTLSEASICEHDFAPESLKCILRLLGVKDKDFPQNRAYLELLTEGKDMSEHEMVLRCNLVSVSDDGILLSPNADSLTTEEMQLAAILVGKIATNIEFNHLSAYRNLVIMDKEADFVKNINILPPHNHVGEKIADLLQETREKSLSLKLFLDEAKKVLKVFSKNNLHYELYPWAVSERSELASFASMHNNLKGAVVCATEIVVGIAKALAMDCPSVQGATGEINTNITEKANTTVALLKNYDFVLTHFNGSDEASHRRSFKEKINFIERIDDEFFARILAEIKEPLRIIVCGDHGTSSLSGKHLEEPVPVIACTLNKPEKIVINNYKDIKRYLFEGEHTNG